MELFPIVIGAFGVVLGFVVGVVAQGRRANQLTRNILDLNDYVANLIAERDEARSRVAKRRRLKSWDA